MRYTAPTRVLRVNPEQPEPDVIAQAAEILRAGGLVAFPTETVYGLGANAMDAEAVARIFSAKDRPTSDPLIVHLADVEQLPAVALDLPPVARELADLWPGPLTLVLKRHSNIPPSVSAGLDSVGVRVPSHPVAHALIAAAGVPIAAPSANRFSRPSATTAAHVLEDLDGHVDLILDGGAANYGIESTIVDVTNEPPRILRYGAYQPEAFEALGFAPAELEIVSEDGESKPAPGMMLKHYSPRARLLFYGDGSPAPDLLRQMRQDAQDYANKGMRVGILARDDEQAAFSGVAALVVALGSTPEQIAARLFAAMRELDRQSVDVILARGYERTGIGAALYERLLRAAEGEIIHIRFS
jgi:L-threonylcarbamoyladenylate synthase